MVGVTVHFPNLKEIVMTWNPNLTKPPNQRPQCRKDQLYQVWKRAGEPAVHKANTLFKKPIKDTSLRVWFGIWQKWEAQGRRSPPVKRK